VALSAANHDYAGSRADCDTSRDESINVAVNSNWAPLTNKELKSISSPCLVYCGELDPYYTDAKKCTEYIPNAKFVSAPGLGHGATWERSDMMLPYIKEFLAQVSKT
jgi:pimeloyl-ACP methyl ester carboxylesterase